MSRSATVTLTFVGDTSQLDSVYEAFVRKASKPIAVPLTGGAVGGGATSSTTTFANAGVPGAVPAPAAPGVAGALPQVTQAYTNLANAVNQQAVAVQQSTQRLREPVVAGQRLTALPPALQSAIAAQDPASAAFLAQSAGGGVGAAVSRTASRPPRDFEFPTEPGPQMPRPWWNRPIGMRAFGLGGAFTAASRAFQDERQYNIDSTLAGSDQRAQLEATLRYRQSLVGSGAFVGHTIGYLQDPSGMGEAETRATLGSSGAIDARTAALGGFRRQTQNLRDQVGISATTTPLAHQMAELDARGRREEQALREASDERAKLDERDVEQVRIGLNASRRRRANASFGTIAGYDKGNASVFIEGQGDERDRREAALVGEDATAVSGMRAQREQQRNAALRTDQMLAGRRNYLDTMAAIREDAPRRASVQRMADDVSVYATRGARRLQAASRLELEADVRQDVEGDANPVTREIRRQRGAARLDAYDANTDRENAASARESQYMAESYRAARFGDEAGALRGRQMARRGRVLDSADFSSPASAFAYLQRQTANQELEGVETRDFDLRRSYRTTALQGEVSASGLAARGQNIAAQAQSVFSRGTLAARQDQDSGRLGDAISQLAIANNELATLKLNYENRGTGAEFGAGTLAPGGTQGNVTLEDMSKTFASIDALTTALQTQTTAINALISGN